MKVNLSIFTTVSIDFSAVRLCFCEVGRFLGGLWPILTKEETRTLSPSVVISPTLRKLMFQILELVRLNDILVRRYSWLKWNSVS